MVQKNYCDVCGKELPYKSWLMRFLIEEENREETMELFQLCHRHKKEISKFINVLKRTFLTGSKSK